jgi:hypothetical protein
MSLEEAAASRLGRQAGMHISAVSERRRYAAVLLPVKTHAERATYRAETRFAALGLEIPGGNFQVVIADCA